MISWKVDSQPVLLTPMFGKTSMSRNDDEEKDIELPGDDDENVGDGSPKKKREKKRKSKEERIAERKVIFWTLIIILTITLGFWLMPRIGSFFRSEPEIIENSEKKQDEKNQAPEKSKNEKYIEITL